MLGEALGRAGIKDFIRLQIDPDTLDVVSFDKRNLSLLLNDLYGPKKSSGERDSGAKVVSDTRSLSRLASVLASDKASSVLHGGKTIDEAEIYVDTLEQSLNRLSKLTEGISVLLRKLLATNEVLSAYRNFDMAVRKFVKESQAK